MSRWQKKKNKRYSVGSRNFGTVWMRFPKRMGKTWDMKHTPFKRFWDK